ncbi:MAG: tetratricopeptide repeat protein [Verrucomicrobiota bacterium]
MESTNVTETIELAESALNDGLTLGRRGLCEDALEALDRAIAACHAFKGESYDVRMLTAQALGNKGAALGDMERYKQALKCYDAAISIYLQEEICWSPTHAGCHAATVMNKGWSLLQLGREDEGFCCHEQSLKMRRLLAESGYAEAVPEVARSLYNIGEGYFNAERYAQALPAFAEAVDILRGLKAAGHDDTENLLPYVLAAQADTLQMLGDLEEAQDISNQAIALFVQLSGSTENPKLASALAAALNGQEIILRKMNQSRVGK